MIRLFCVALLLSTACFAGERKADADESNTIRISLWNGHAPVGGDKYANEDAWITVYRPQKANGTAIVICPGGGYRAKMIGPEGHGIAAWLNRHGITGIVLDYRLPAGRAFVPLLDAQRALRTVRARAKEWDLEPAANWHHGLFGWRPPRSTADTHFDDGHASAADPIDRVSCRPDFAILVYPVITMGEHITHSGSQRSLLGEHPSPDRIKLFSNEKQVTSRTPPTFLRMPAMTKQCRRKTARRFTKRSVPTRLPPNT